MNVSSIVVKTGAEHLQEVIESINSLEYCEVHFSDPEGKIVVTIEGETINDQIGTMKIIQGLPNVYSANLSFSYCEDELIKSLGEIGENQSSRSLE